MQDPEEFIANGGWNFLDLEGGSDEEEGEEEVFTACLFQLCYGVAKDWIFCRKGI